VDSSDVEWLRQLEDDVRSGKRRADESVCLAARVGAGITGVGAVELECSIPWALGKLAPGPVTVENAAVELARALARDERRRQVRRRLALLPPGRRGGGAGGPGCLGGRVAATPTGCRRG
jgi:hypothetical protein